MGVSTFVTFVLAAAAFAWGLSLATYRWVAEQNAWPMGVWQAERPALPRTIGLAAAFVAMLVAASLGGGALPMLILLGAFGAVAWTGLLKVGAQSALLLAPAAVVLVLAGRALGTI